MFPSQSKSRRYPVIFLILCIYCLIRPIATISFFSTHHILGVTFLEFFSLSTSYLFLLLILLHLRAVRLDGAGLFILFFCFYCALSVLWGSRIREVLRLILPALAFFMVRITVREEWQIKRLLVLMLIGYILPVLGSALLISLGKSVYMTIYFTGLERYTGMYLKIHSLAHAMFIFSTIFLIYLSLDETAQAKRPFFIYFCYLLSILAIYNLYFTYTRTVFVGLTILVSWYLLGRRSYKLLAIALLVMVVIVLTSSHFETIFYDVYEPLRGETGMSKMGSGRIGGWSNMITTFSNFSFELKAIGFGAGGLLGNSTFSLVDGHSDLISLLFTLGIIGFLLYMALILKLFHNIAKSNMKRLLKYISLGFLFAVFAMNFVSNSYLARFELGQYFFFFIGIFSVLRDISYSKAYQGTRTA